MRLEVRTLILFWKFKDWKYEEIVCVFASVWWKFMWSGTSMWNDADGEVLGLGFKYSKHNKLMGEFQKIATALEWEKLFQIAIDSSNVNRKSNETISFNRNDKLFYMLLDIEKCSLHSVNKRVRDSFIWVYESIDI